jgi:glycosyltransferase involved in cell wall biosynthesis
VLNKSLTVVLPVYNAESRLRKNVSELLELASEFTAEFGVLIIDDGSTDSTFEVAAELAAHYPQVTAWRHRHRRGLGPTIEYVQRRVRTDAVLLHDGITPMDPQQMRHVLRRWVAQSVTGANDSPVAPVLRVETCDFANLSLMHAAMERAHNQVIGFQVITPLHEESVLSDNASFTSPTAPRTDEAHFPRRVGLGQVPRPPRPKFLSALAQFALGE